VLNCDIDVIDTLTLAKLVTPGDKTDAAGFYEVIVPAGYFDLSFQPPVATLLASVVRDNVHIGQDTVVDVTVPAGFLVNGTVKSPTNALIADVDLDIFDSATQATVLAAGDKTNALGSYAMVLLSNTYDLEFEPLKTRRLQAKRIANVNIASNQTLPVVLDSGLSISGVISGSPPMSGVNVDAIIQSSGLVSFQPGDSSDATGFYQVIVGFVPHTLVFYPRVATGKTARAFTNVNPGADFVLNVPLTSGFLVSGTVTNSIGAPLSGVRLRAESGVDWVPTSEGVSGVTGTYQTVLAPGTYRLLYIPVGGSGLATLEFPSVVITQNTVIDVQFPGLGCSCPCQYDPKCDFTVSDVLDVVETVNRAFRGFTPPAGEDAGCPYERRDVNASGAVDVIDVVKVVNVAFRGGTIAASYVNPCAAAAAAH
jgi:hypothetical protein